MRLATFDNICLVEYTAFYTWEYKKIITWKKSHVIRHVRYN